VLGIVIALAVGFGWLLFFLWSWWLLSRPGARARD